MNKKYVKSGRKKGGLSDPCKVTNLTEDRKGQVFFFLTSELTHCVLYTRLLNLTIRDCSICVLNYIYFIFVLSHVWLNFVERIIDNKWNFRDERRKEKKKRKNSEEEWRIGFIRGGVLDVMRRMLEGGKGKCKVNEQQPLLFCFLEQEGETTLASNRQTLYILQNRIFPSSLLFLRLFFFLSFFPHSLAVSFPTLFTSHGVYST